MMELIIDTRENRLIDLLKPKINLQIQQLDIGDIQILYNKIPYIIFERKSLNDLKASIKDGRYKEQKYRLLEYKQQQEELGNNIKIMYIIEEFLTYNNPVEINGAIINTNIRDNIPIITTRNLDDTHRYILELFIRLKNNPDKYIMITKLNDTNYLDTIKTKKKKSYITNDNIMALQLAQIPNISQSMGEKIQKEFGSIINMIQQIKEKEDIKDKIKLIADIQYTDKRKIGKKIAETLIEYMQIK